MGKRNRHSYKKFQKELDRKKKAAEKMARRQGKKDLPVDAIEIKNIPIDLHNLSYITRWIPPKGLSIENLRRITGQQA